MLAYNVAALLKSPPGTTGELVVDEPAPSFGADLVAVAPVRGLVRLFRTQDAIIARCDLHTTIQLECSRCLESYPAALGVHFEEQFLPTVNIVTGAAAAIADDQALRIDDRHVLDLTEVLRQYLLTALPLKPICAPECRGLCPGCGTNLNSGACTCTPQPVTGPFGALATLLDGADEDQRAAR